jgi:uncharacterized membrane protein YbhN (UPF0104 family)
LKTESLKNRLTNTLVINKNRIFFIIRILIAAGLISFLISYLNFSEIYSALEEANYILILLAGSLLVVNVFLQFRKWKLTCKSILEEDNNKTIFTSLLHGFAGGAFTPARIGEYFGRAVVFKEKSLLQVTVATFLDKFFVLIILAFIGSAASILFIHFYYEASVYLTVSLFVVVFALFYLLILLLISPQFWDNFFFNRLRESKKLYKIFGKLRVLKNLDRTYSLKMSLISLLFYFCYIIQFAILVSAFTHSYNYFDYLWSGNLVMFAKTFIPAISFGELGIREGASVFFLGEMGVTESAAFNASIFLFIINVLIPSLIGLVMLFKKNNG